MKVHTFQKNPKRSGHMKAHNIILEFAPSGMCETNIYGEKLIRTSRQTSSKYESRITSRSSLGESTPVITISITILCFLASYLNLS
jgi:hypothetical protein